MYYLFVIEYQFLVVSLLQQNGAFAYSKIFYLRCLAYFLLHSHFRFRFTIILLISNRDERFKKFSND